MIEQYTSPVAVNNSQEPWLVGEGVVVSGGVAIPSLDFNFITGGLPGTVTFTRASTATYFDSAGVLTSAAINAPRFDYNPATLAAQGLLIEEQRTNSLLRSEDFATTWLITGTASVSTNVASSPAATTTADKFILGNTITSANAAVVQTVTKAASATTYTASVFVKAAEFNSLRFLFRDTGVAGNNVQAYFNANTGTIASAATAAGTFTAPSATISNIGSGWYRVTLTGTTSTETSIDVRLLVYQNGTGTATGNGTDGILLWGAQLEAGAFATSYIPTTTTALTRSADVASVNTLSPWYNATESTLYLEFTPVGMKSVGGTALVSIDNGATATERIALVAASNNGMQNITTVAGSTSGNSQTPATIYAANTTYKIAMAVKLNDIQSFANGVAGTAGTTALMPSGLTNLQFNKTYAIATSNNGWIRRFTYYPRRLSAAEGQAITA